MENRELTLGTNTELTSVLEQVVVQGDLAKLSATDRVVYYNKVCESLGLNPLTQPFQYITLNGKLTLYARRDCTDQLRKLHQVSLTIASSEVMSEVYVVTAKATLPNGRTDESTGVVTISTLKGDALANALMKAETKAKRRVTLSIVGLGWLDETEIETIPQAHHAEQVEGGESEELPASPILSQFEETQVKIQAASTLKELQQIQMTEIAAKVAAKKLSSKDANALEEIVRARKQVLTPENERAYSKG